MKKVIIVGGVASGASAAARLRRLDENIEIIIIEKTHYVSYANCGLPYYLGDVIKDENTLLVQTPKALYDRFRIDVRVDSEVISVDTDNKEVTIKDKDREYKESYDYLVLAPGSTYRKLYENEDKLAHLKNVEDVKYLKDEVDKASKIAIIGGGFIGIETAENLKEIGKDVTIFEYAPQILANLDADMAKYLEDELVSHGVNLLVSARINDIEIGDKYLIKTSDNEYEFDLVIVAAGVRANTDFLKGSNIKLDDRGFIITDEYMRTNVDNVYAAGDAIVNKHFISGNLENVALAGPANKQGRIIADNIYGLNHKYDGSIGTSIIKVFNLAGGSVGLNTNRLKGNYNFKTIITHPFNHATYYPNAKQLHIKVFFEVDTHRILGAQAIGEVGVDKFIDVIATAIKLKAKVEDLKDLELAYAPPFLSAKSPANFIGYIAENIFDGLEDLIIKDDLKEGDILLDVRFDREYELGHLENSIHIPLDELRDRIAELEEYKDKVINVYCAVGIRAHIVSRILINNGYKARNISGGYNSLKD